MKPKKSNKPYDKILKENIGEFFLSLSEKYLGIAITKSEEIKEQLQTTLEKEADFLRIIHTTTQEKLILHLEFQTTDEKEMVYRMQEYFAILQKKYKLPIKQFVIYLGEKEPQMRTKLEANEVFTGFELKNLHLLDYETVLDSDIPEEIMLAILCDFKQEEAKEVLAKIIQRLQLWSKDAITLQKYIRQILVLSRLRKLELVTTQQLKDMALVYDIEQDALFKEGEEKGLEKGKHQKTIQGVQKALQRGRLSIEEIAEDFEVSIEFVLQVQRGEIK
jgi:hypothetical protein